MSRVTIERIHYLLARNLQRVRYAKGWTQEDCARAFRDHGLAAWRGSTVGQFESRSCRFPSLDELLLMCAALGISLIDLIPEGDEKVNLADGAAFTASELRVLLIGAPDAAPVPMADKRVERVRDVPSGAERHAARKLETSPAVIRSAAKDLWGQRLDDERDARIENLGELSPRSIQAQRGFVTRQMLRELKQRVAAAGPGG